MTKEHILSYVGLVEAMHRDVYFTMLLQSRQGAPLRKFLSRLEDRIKRNDKGEIIL